MTDVPADFDAATMVSAMEVQRKATAKIQVSFVSALAA